jgi:hypothetical protein
VKLFCGIDWAEGHHDLAVIDAEGQLVAKKRITDDPAGFAELVEVLPAAGDSVEDPVPWRSKPRAVYWWRRCAPPGARFTRSTRWRWPDIGSASRWRGQSPITLMR